MTKDSTATAPAVPEQSAVDLVASMMTMIPEASVDDDAEERILRAVLDAATVEDIDAPWRSSGLEDKEGRALRVNELTRFPADKPGGLPFYLRIRGVDLETGSEFTCTSGSKTVVAQLVKCFMADALPVDVRPVVNETRSGNKAHHLEFLGRGL